MLPNLSIRYKIPLRSIALMVLAATAVSGALTVRAYDDLKSDVAAAAESLGQLLAVSLVTEMLHDDVWHAYELISAPGRAQHDRPGSHPALVVVVDNERKVYVSSAPEEFPMQTDAFRPGGKLASLPAQLREAGSGERLIEPAGSDSFYMVMPIAFEGARLGTLVMGYPQSVLRARFNEFATRAAWITLAIVALLVPIIWVWASRLATPLVDLASHMGNIAHEVPDPASLRLYETQDEIGQVGQAFRRMVHQLREKDRLEQQVVVSERLAALGRLSAGIAHEINNPLGGMLNAVDTLRRHGKPDPITSRTLSLLERGLAHIRETVGALLVEAKLAPHALACEDIEDVMTLAQGEARRKSARLEWRNGLPQSVDLPATQVRQILLNLLLNAVQAVEPGGRVACEVAAQAEGVLIRVFNDGNHIPAEQLPYIFEPFSSSKETGHGLGLWITYQVVNQLRGTIRVTSSPGETVFSVGLPYEHIEETTLAA